VRVVGFIGVFVCVIWCCADWFDLLGFGGGGFVGRPACWGLVCFEGEFGVVMWVVFAVGLFWLDCGHSVFSVCSGMTRFFGRFVVDERWLGYCFVLSDYYEYSGFWVELCYVIVISI